MLKPKPKPGAVERLFRRMGFAFTVSVLLMVVSVALLTLFYWAVEGDQAELVGEENRRGLFDWFYFTIITTRTIGFGDITPKTFLGKLGTVFNALLPASLFFGASLVVLQSFFRWLETSYRRWRMRSKSGHYVVVADEELMETIVQELGLLGKSHVCVIDKPQEKLPPRLQEMLGDESYYEGDPTRDEVLAAVSIHSAGVIVIASPDDNVNLYVLVTARGLAPGVKTVVRVNRAESESKFRSIGADLLLPAGTMLGRMLSRAAVSPVALDLLVRLQTGTQKPDLEEVTIAPGQAGRSVREAVPNTIAVRRGGQFIFALETLMLQPGDVALRIATE